MTTPRGDATRIDEFTEDNWSAEDEEWQQALEAEADRQGSPDYLAEQAELKMEFDYHDDRFREVGTPEEVTDRDRRLTEAQAAMSAAREGRDREALDGARQSWEDAWWTTPAADQGDADSL